MLDALPLVVPTQQGRLVGTVHPAPGARRGLVILGDRRDPAPEWPELYEELALYAQAAGYDVLRVDYREPEQLDVRAFDLLGAVMALRAQGAERVLVISRARAASGTTPAQGERAIIPGFIKSVLQMSGTSSQLTEHMAEMVGMVSEVVETIVATATIVTQTQRRRRPASSVMRQRVLDAATRGDDTAPGAIDSRSRAGQLVVQVGEEVDAKERVRLIATLYGWCNARSYGGARDSHMQGQTTTAMAWAQASETEGARARVAESRAAFHATHAWLEDRWARVLRGLEARDPELAAALPKVLSTGEGKGGVSMRDVRRAWRYLDAQARNEWMSAFSDVVRQMVMTTLPPPYVSGERTQPEAPASRDA